MTFELFFSLSLFCLVVCHSYNRLYELRFCALSFECMNGEDENDSECGNSDNKLFLFLV